MVLTKYMKNIISEFICIEFIYKFNHVDTVFDRNVTYVATTTYASFRN